MQSVKRIVLVIPVIALFLVSCATPRAKTPDIGEAKVEREAMKQRMLVIESNIQDQAKLMDVNYNILKGAACFCKKRAMFSGFSFVMKGCYEEEEYREAAVKLLDLGEYPKVVHIVSGSPAEKSEMREGDEIVLVQGRVVPNKPEEMKEMIESLLRGKDFINMTVKRDGAHLSIEMQQFEGCNYCVQLLDDERINALTDGERIYVSKGLLRFVSNDTELAAVISHELAHCVRGHVDMIKVSQSLGGLTELVLDFKTLIVTGHYGGYLKSMEREADYVSLYIMAVAGYDYTVAPDFYRRLAIANPKSIAKNFARTHPSSPERFVAMEETVKEIDDKKSKGLMLIPEEKPVPGSEKDSSYEDRI